MDVTIVDGKKYVKVSATDLRCEGCAFENGEECTQMHNDEVQCWIGNPISPDYECIFVEQSEEL